MLLYIENNKEDTIEGLGFGGTATKDLAVTSDANLDEKIKKAVDDAIKDITPAEYKGTNDLNDEAIQNIGYVYNRDNLTVSNLRVTNSIQVGTEDKGAIIVPYRKGMIRVGTDDKQNFMFGTDPNNNNHAYIAPFTGELHTMGKIKTNNIEARGAKLNEIKNNEVFINGWRFKEKEFGRPGIKKMTLKDDGWFRVVDGGNSIHDGYGSKGGFASPDIVATNMHHTKNYPHNNALVTLHTPIHLRTKDGSTPKYIGQCCHKGNPQMYNNPTGANTKWYVEYK